MGIWSRIGGFFRRLVGAKPKEAIREKDKKEIKKTSEEKSLEKIIGESEGREKEELKPLPPYPDEEEEIKIREEVTKRKEDEKSRLKRFIEKNKAFKPYRKTITDSTKKEWQTILNQRKMVVSTGYFASYESLMKSRYDVYRNVIMGAIRGDDPKSRELIQQIYQSGVLDEHIVARLKLILKSSRADKGTWVREIEYEIQGLTPDKALNYNLHNRLIGLSGDTLTIKRAVENVCQTEVYEKGGYGSSSNEVVGVEISFNYA